MLSSRAPGGSGHLIAERVEHHPPERIAGGLTQNFFYLAPF